MDLLKHLISLLLLCSLFSPSSSQLLSTPQQRFPIEASPSPKQVENAPLVWTPVTNLEAANTSDSAASRNGAFRVNHNTNQETQHPQTYTLQIFNNNSGDDDDSVSTMMNTEEKLDSQLDKAPATSTTTTTTTGSTVFVSPPITTLKLSSTIQTSSQSPFHPLLIYSTRHEIRSFDLYYSILRNQSSNFYSSSNGYMNDVGHHIGKHSKTLIAGLKNTIGLDFYYSDSECYIFWTDVTEERIYRGTILNGTVTSVEVVIQTGLATAEGLAVDWIGQNIYWVESSLDHIEVANMNGSFRRTLLAGDMESPRAISVDPRVGLLFWTDWDKKNPRIERATMSGEDRKVIVNIKEVNGGWPNGLTLDYDYKRIYWIDASSDSIHAADYEGYEPQTLLRSSKSLGHPFSTTLFENNLFWTDWKTTSISMANKFNGSEVRELQRLTNRPFDIKVFHPSRQPKMANELNPCYINNGNCSHLCLLSSDHKRICECPHLMRLQKDGRTCESYELVLLIGRTNEIRAVDIDRPLHHVMAPISVPKVFYPRQFEYDTSSKTIFWVDSQTNEVKRAHLSGNSIDTIIDVIIESPTGLALDWLSGTIYVTSSLQSKAPGKIFISNLNGEYISILMDEKQGIVSPKSIAVHPTEGIMFWVDENNQSEPIIMMARMDGSSGNIIASKLNDPILTNPTSLAIDYESHRVYWINQAHNASDNASIQYYDMLDGKIITVLDESEVEPKRKINPTVLCVDGAHLIVGGRAPTESILKMPKSNVDEKSIIHMQILDQVTALRVYNASAQVGQNACSQKNGGCSQLCIPVSLAHRVCKCTIGYSINPRNETECLGKDLFLIYSYNLGMKGISLEPNSSPEDYYLPPIHKAYRASSIDYVHNQNLIYWVDNEEGSITRINRDTTNYKVIVQSLEAEESIAIDWVAGNIYWLDPYYDIIEVARLNGSNRYVIVSGGDMDKANGIVVNPLMGYIAWSDIGAYPKIETARLDGSNRQVIVSTSLSHVDDLAIDYVQDYIYWVDSTLSLIERIKPDGTKREIIYNGSAPNSHNHLVSIALFKDYLYIADSAHHQGSIMRCNKNTAEDKVYIQQHLGEGIRDMAIFAEQPMPTVDENPCSENNGGCQDLCLYMGVRGKRRCICSHGKLIEDGRTCKPYDTFILFSKLSQIDSLHIKEDEPFNNSPYPPIAIENRSNIISLTVDYSAQRVIYSDITRDQICSIHFNGTDRKVLVEKQSSVEGIAFADDQLYWTSTQNNSISRLNTTSSGILKKFCDNSGCHNAPVERLIYLTNEDKPRGIAIDSCTLYVYWTNWNINASIQRASPHTGYKIESIITTSIKVPNGIAIDHELRKLYWCDARLDKIETCDMDGTNRAVLSQASPQHPFALTIFDNYVFWTDWISKGVFKADKFTGKNPTQVKKVVQRPMGIAVVAEQSINCSSENPVLLTDCIQTGCQPGYTCTRSLLILGEYECKRMSGVSHDLTLPKPHCKHSKNGSCEPWNYHDILMNNMERYNLTELFPLEPKTTPPIISAMRPRVNQNQSIQAVSNSTMQPRVVHVPTTFYTPNPSIVTSTVPSYVKRNQTYATVLRDAINLSTSETTTSYRELTTLVNSTSPSPPPITTTKVASHISIITSTPTPITTSQTTIAVTTATNESLPTSTAMSVVTENTTPSLQANVTIPPCQIVPAALQPTTDLINNGGGGCKADEFRCYLSEKPICIYSNKRCDGEFDCPKNEDENGCHFFKKGFSAQKREENWYKFVTVILIILAASVAAMVLVFGNRNRRGCSKWFAGSGGAFNHRRMFDDNGTNIEISNPMFDEDDSGNMVHCAFSIDLNERTTNFSNPLYERQVLLMNDKHVTTN